MDAPTQREIQEPLIVRVGVTSGDIVGSSERALQAAVDYVAALGGGTVKVLPGEYRLNNAVYLRSGVKIEGSGDETRLVKNPSVRTSLEDDSDWYESVVRLKDPAGFRVGGGIALMGKNPNHDQVQVLTRTIVGRSGKTFWLDRPLGQNFWTDREAEIATLFPLITGEEISDAAITNLVLDGNRAQNDHINGNYAGGIFLQRCDRIHIEGVHIQNYNGDGISWQICHDVTVKTCRSTGNADLGLHPGSGSQRPVVVENYIERNRIGIFVCWGVKDGLFEKNRVVESGDYGLSIGHRDTDNQIRDNVFEGSGQIGILFRSEQIPERCAHRNVVERNRIVNTGSSGNGVAIDIRGETQELVFRANSIVDDRPGDAGIGMRIGEKVGDVTLDGNEFQGVTRETIDLREASHRTEEDEHARTGA